MISCEMEDTMLYQDIPRIYTAIAEWGSCLVYLYILKKENMKSVHFLAGSLFMLAMQSIFLTLTGNVTEILWIPCMMTAAGMMYIFLMVGGNMKPLGAAYCCARAFVLAEFTASLQWQMVSGVQTWGNQSIWVEILITMVIFGGCSEHSIVRDMFLFACYAGTSYVDVVAITPDNLSRDDNGALWLKYRRGKNGQLSRVKLLPEAIALIEKYRDETRATLFPVIPYQALKWCLTSIKIKAGIKGRLSYHMGRHSFSTLMTLENGVPIETVSKMLGHADIRTTQVYARVTPKKLFEDMDKYIEATKDLKLVL